MTKEDKPAPLDSRFRGNDKKEFPRRPKGSEGREETPQVAPKHAEQDRRQSEAAPEGLAKLRSKTKAGAKRRPAGLRSQRGDKRSAGGEACRLPELRSETARARGARGRP